MGEAFETYLRLHGIKELKLTKVDCKVLHNMPHSCIQSLRVLVLQGIDDIDGWLSDSASVLAQSTALQILKICDVGLTSAKELFQALSRSTSIKELHFSVNSEFLCQMGGLGEEIEVFLSANNTTTSLFMCNCITDHGVKYLIAGLKSNSCLVKLDVRNNPLSINAIEETIRVAVSHRRLDQISIEGNDFHKQGMKWTLNQGSTNKVTAKLFCALANLSILEHCYHQIVNLSVSCNDLDTFVCIKLFQVLQQNKFVEEITFTSLTANDMSVSHALKDMFAMNKTFKKLQYHSNKNEVQHDYVYESIGAGISESLSLRSLSVKLSSFSSISKVIRGLRNCRLIILEISPDFSCRSPSLTQDDSISLGNELYQFLASNSTLVNLTLGFILDDGIVSGIAEGLQRNRSLKTLYITLGPLVSHGLAKLFCSANCKLTSIEIESVGSLIKEDDHWNLTLDTNGIALWSQLRCITQTGYKITLSQSATMNLPYSYQVCKVFSAFSLSKNLTKIDFSKLRTLDKDKLGKRKVGLALRSMLITASSLETLIFNSGKLPDGVWEYAAEGLSSNSSLKVLDLCSCGLSRSEATSIFASLKSNNKLEMLDISKNSDIKQGDPKLNSAIEAMFQFNSSICDVNLKESVGDAAVIKAVNGLKRNQSSGLKKLALDDQSFSVGTLQHLLLVVKDRFGLVLEFSEVTLTLSAEPNIWLNYINMTYHEYPIRASRHLKQCKLAKLFCSMCNICLRDKIVVNVVELEFSNIDDDETVIALFKLLSQETLSKLQKLSLKGKFQYMISGDVASCNLKTMLASNKSLRKLELGTIDEAVATGLMLSLLENNSLLILHFTLKSLGKHFVSSLLAALNCPNSGLLEVKISGLLPIHRPTRWSVWSMELYESVLFGIVSITLFPQFICEICEACSICPDGGIAKSILSSLSHLELSVCDLDITLLVNLFKSLETNCTFKTLALTVKGKPLKGVVNEKMSVALRDMLVHNTALRMLNISGALDSEVACGIIAGLKRNKSLESLRIDESTSNLKFIVAIIKMCSEEESSVTSLFVKDLFTLQKHTHLCLTEWKIKVCNETKWCSFLSMLKDVTPRVKLVTALDSLDHGGCVGNSPRFDIACKTLNFQVLKKEVTRINVKLLLANVTTIENLAIKGYFISEDACCDIIHSARNLKKLELTHDSINGNSALRLIHELTDSEGIVLDELNISNNNLNRLSSDLGHALKKLLESCKLKVLKCAGCRINDDVCVCIASGIQCNCEVTCLDLSCNDITSVGAMKLMASLQQNSCLEELNLSGNPLFAGVSSQTTLGQAVSKMLECNHTLVNLNFDCNVLDIATLKEISSGLKNNQALKILAVNISTCNTRELSSQIQLLSTKLTCFNFSETCSLFSSDAGWTVEVKGNSLLLTTLCSSEIDINHIVISKGAVSELDLSECHLSCSQLQSLLRSLEDNCVVKELVLSVSRRFTYSKRELEDLRSSLESALKKNCTLTNLVLLGAVSDEVIQGLEAGIKVNDSIRVLSVEVMSLEFSTFAKFVQSLEISGILSITLRPLIGLSRRSISSMWQVEGYNPSVMLLKFISFLNQGGVKHCLLSQLSSLKFDENNIQFDESLTCSLIQDHSSVAVSYLKIPTFWTMEDKAHCALERMITCNNCLQHLAFDSINDSVAMAIARGLKDNKTLQVLEMNVEPLSKSALTQLLQSLSDHPLKLIPRGHCIMFVRYISELQSNMRTVAPLAGKLPNLERVLQCLSVVHCQDLTIAPPLSQPRLSFGDKAIGNALKEVLKNCKSLKILKLQCAVSIEVIQCIAAGLKENCTLCFLQIGANSASMRLNDILPLFSSLDHSRVTKLELVQQYVLTKPSGKTCWRLEHLRYFDQGSSFQNLSLIHSHIEVDLFVCRPLDTVVLKLCSENIKLILVILKSIECGTFPVKCLHLVYDNMEGNESKTTGKAIETMLTVNKSLEKLTIMHLRESVFEDHIVSGLCRTSTLTRVVIQDKRLPVERNNLVKKVIGADFTDSSVRKIKIDDIISLHRNSIKIDPDWRIQRDSRLGFSKAKEILVWKINSDDKNTIVRAFFLLSQTISGCNFSDSSIIIGKSVLDNLSNLDISHTCINFVALFEILQNDSRVISLNLSHSTQPDSVDISQRNEKFKSMLIHNTSLEFLNLTGIMDETLASSLIEVLPSCSLTSLSLDLNVNAYTFDKVEALVSSYVNSKLTQLTFMDVCHLLKQVEVHFVPQCISLECHLALPLSSSLLKSCSALFMLICINKEFSRLNLTLGTMDHLTLKVYQMFFGSVNQGYQIDRPSAPTNLLQSLKALQIDITHDTVELVITILESLQCCETSCLEELRLSHDRSFFIFTSTLKCQELASCYKQLLSSNETLQTANFGQINDVIAQGVAAGLKSRNSKVFSVLQFNARLLTTTSVASFIRVFDDGRMTCLQITDGITIKKIEDGSRYSVDVFGNNVFLCKIFIALTRPCPHLVTGFASGHKLDLSVQDVHTIQPLSIRSMLACDVMKHIMDGGGSYVTELILSRNEDLTKDDEDSVGSTLEQLLISDSCILCSLKLDACQIPDTVCVKISEGLTENKTLEKLDLSRNLLTSYGVAKLLASLGTNDTLLELNLSDNELSDSQAVDDEIGNEIEDMIKENCTLTKLHLDSKHNCLPPLIAKKIATGLFDNKALRTLSLQIKEEEVIIKLFESLQHNQVLNELCIEGSSVSNTSVGSSVQKMLKCNRSIEILKMGYSGITDEVCELIADGLSSNKQLKTLNLCNNRICSNGMIRLFQVLDANKCCLKELNVSMNCDSWWRASVSDGVQLDTILATNSSLEVLILSDGGYFGEWFGLELFKGLKCNSTLHTLDISRNYFDATASKAFTQMIESNKTLIELDISYCQFTFWNLKFANTSLQKVTISANLRSLFDTETSEMEIHVMHHT